MTDIELKEYIDQRFDLMREDFESRACDNGKFAQQLEDKWHERLSALDRLVGVQLQANAVALEKAEAQLNKRLETMNEFRQQLKLQSGEFFTRPEHVIFADKIEGDIRLLRESKALLEGKASQHAVNVSTVIGLIGLILALVALIHAYTK